MSPFSLCPHIPTKLRLHTCITRITHPLFAGVRKLVDANTEDHLAPSSRNHTAHPAPRERFRVRLRVARLCGGGGFPTTQTGRTDDGEKGGGINGDSERWTTHVWHEQHKRCIDQDTKQLDDPGLQEKARAESLVVVSFSLLAANTCFTGHKTPAGYVPNTLLTGVINIPGTSAEPSRTAVGLEKSAGLT